jgi:hypothetical protein
MEKKPNRKSKKRPAHNPATKIIIIIPKATFIKPKHGELISAKAKARQNHIPVNLIAIPKVTQPNPHQLNL